MSAIPPAEPARAAPPAALPTANVLGHRIALAERGSLIEQILHAARMTRTPFLVDYLNAAQFNRAESDPEFAGLLRGMNLIYADGQSIVWAARRDGVALPGRLTAGDFIGDFFRRAAAEGVSIALLGARPGIATAFASYWTSQVPGLEIRFSRDGYFDAREEPSVLESIEAANADVVLVGMGAPRQEEFVARAAASGVPRVWWCVGALFEYGPWGKRRAPSWMRRAGLEWVFRFAQEPRRLAGRYLVGNPLFLWRVLTRRPES